MFVKKNNYQFVVSNPSNPWIVSFSAFSTLASGASIARGRPPLFGGARLAPPLRSRWDRIGQKPEPTIRRGMMYKGSLREGAGAYTELRKQLHRSSRSESAVEGERVTIKLIKTPKSRRLLPSRFACHLPPGGRLSPVRTCRETRKE